MNTFDPISHIYRIDGVVVPSVTQVLVAEGFIDATWFTEYSRDKGINKHLTIHYYETDQLDEENLDPVLKNTLDAWKAFKLDTGFVVSASETPLYSAQYRFAGTPDILGTFRDTTPAIIDFKGQVVSPWVGLQLAAQEILEGTHGRKRFALQLMDTGKYKLHLFTDRQDRNIFMAALSIHHWKRNHVKKG